MRNTKNVWLSMALTVMLGGALLVGCSSKEAKQETAPTASTQPAPAPAPAPAESTGTSSSTTVSKKSTKRANLGASSAGNSR